MGAVSSGLDDPVVIIGFGISGSIAMGISGFSGAYLTESAERERELNQLRKAMLNKMTTSVHESAGRFASIVTSVVDGLSPALAAMVVTSPFFLAHWGLMSIPTAFFLSLVITLVSLALLGIYLAGISDMPWFNYGVKMLLVGATTAVLTFIVGLLLGGTPV